MLFVTEIFQSIQGESEWAGYPCTFIRLAGCNLRCSYCDTTYARSGGRPMEIKRILQEVRKLGISLVEITGGEPLLQEETPALVRELIRQGNRVLVETNGTLDISLLPPKAIRIMDLKCPSSRESDKNLWKNISHLRSTDQIKFVMANRTDYLWAKSMIKKYSLHEKCPILFSAVWKKLPPAQLASWMVKDKSPARLQVQLHKILWPLKDRGV